ncbi:hypothetical protein [Kitasatospora phosalacinea]|uniref:DUF304 domain-containing protein n=1 Tax=Kitasatospora phosalacinea TaxID=2065 RepID=A0ABW6GNB5_9ACTN
MSARRRRRPHLPPAGSWRPRDGGAPTRTVRRSRVRAVLRAVLGRPVPLGNLLVWIPAGAPTLSVPVRIAAAVGAVLLLAQSLWSELRTSVEFRARELVVTNSFARYVLSPEDIQKIRYSDSRPGPPNFSAEHLELTHADGRWIDLGVSLGLSPRRRAELCDLLHDWTRANQVHTDVQVLGPQKRWSN